MCSGSCVVECADVTCKSQASINGDSSGTDYANGNYTRSGTSGNFGCGTASCGYDCSAVCGKGASCRASNADYGVYGRCSGESTGCGVPSACSLGCQHLCLNSCYNECVGSCNSGCYGYCSGSCNEGCYGSCSGTCYNSACSAGCSGSCTACTGGCSGNINKEK